MLQFLWEMRKNVNVKNRASFSIDCFVIYSRDAFKHRTSYIVRCHCVMKEQVGFRRASCSRRCKGGHRTHWGSNPGAFFGLEFNIRWPTRLSGPQSQYSKGLCTHTPLKARWGSTRWGLVKKYNCDGKTLLWKQWKHECVFAVTQVRYVSLRQCCGITVHIGSVWLWSGHVNIPKYEKKKKITRLHTYM